MLKFGEGVSFDSALQTFLETGVNELRGTNPNTGVILVHQSDHLTQEEMENDAVQGLHNQHILRDHYSSCVIMHQPELDSENYQLIFELRNGKPIATKNIELVEDKWGEVGETDTGHNLVSTKGRKAA